MGGPGSGGRRIGAGRRRKDAALALIHGSRQRHTEAEAPATRPPQPPVAPPEALAPEARAIWHTLAPRAVAARTLTDIEVPAFTKLCEAIVRQDKVSTQMDKEGWTYEVTTPAGTVSRKHPLWPDYNTLERRIVAGFQHFCLEPFGKPIVPVEQRHEEQDTFTAFQQAHPRLARIK